MSSNAGSDHAQHGHGHGHHGHGHGHGHHGHHGHGHGHAHHGHGHHHHGSDAESESDTALPEPVGLRQSIYAALFDPNRPGNLQPFIDNFTMALIVAIPFALLFENVPEVYDANQDLFHFFDTFSLAVFTIEYLLRLYTAPEIPVPEGKTGGRLRWMLEPMSLVDLAAILPFYLSLFFPLNVGALRAIRLLRLAKLSRILFPAIREFAQRNRGRTLRQKVHSLIFQTPTSGKLHVLLDNFLVIWVLISVVAVILETVPSIHDILSWEFKLLDYIAVAIFSTEYVLRLYSVPEDPEFKNRHDALARLNYAKTRNAIIDLLAVLPFFLEVFLHHLFDLRFLRVFRLMRLLKLTRNSGAMDTLGKVVIREWRVLYAAGFVMILLVILTASFGYLLEHEAQPDKFENIPQSIYWAVITLASVGYGDISPVTPMGRAMTVILAFLGIGIFAIPAGLLASAFTDQLRLDREAFEETVRVALHDGHLSQDEKEMLEAEAARLHMPRTEVDRIMKKVRHQMAEELLEERERIHEQHARIEAMEALRHEHEHAGPGPGGGGVSYEQLASNPEMAFEQARILIGELRVLGAAADPAKLDQLFSSNDRATEHERSVWNLVARKS